MHTWMRGAAAFAIFCFAMSWPTASPGGARGWEASGVWRATLSMGGREVPFRFGIGGSAQHPVGWFYNGDVREVSTGGLYRGHQLTLEFGQYARRLVATLHDGHLQGTYGPVDPPSQPGFPVSPVSAVRAAPASASGPTSAAAPASAGTIAGQGVIVTTSDQEDLRAWRFVVRQRGDAISAAILRMDGDTGELTGTWRDGHAILSHFDGARPAVLDLSATTEGGLHVVLHDLHGGQDSDLSAYRADDPRAQSLLAAADAEHHTGVRDPREPFAFSFPDLDGRLVANTDPRFRHKVIVLDVSGSWCPNCHDEAPFLEELYRKYHARGLEVVSLSFEEPAQLATLARLKTFIARYGLTYTVLVGGTPEQARARLPQTTRLDSWPTTFFIGRDGRVAGVHTGFAARPTGSLHRDLRREFEAKIERLLAEPARS